MSLQFSHLLVMASSYNDASRCNKKKGEISESTRIYYLN